MTRIALDPRRVLRVAGVEYRADVARAVCASHPDCRLATTDDGVRTYLLEGELVPEPDNRVDPAAIAVMVDSQRIGYVPAVLCATFHEQLAAHAPWVAEVEVCVTIHGSLWIEATFDRRRR